MKKISISLLALASTLTLVPVAMAGPITGAIGINGSNDTWSLTELKFTKAAHNATVADAPTTSGTLAAAIGDFVTFTTNPLIFATADGKELFSTGDGITFTITSLTVDEDTSSFLNLNGTGTLTENGYTITDAEWTLSSSKTGGTTFGIDAATDTDVPEPNSLLLLGSGLFGLAFVAFRKSKSAGMMFNA